MIEFRRLLAFVAVAEEGHITRAAKRLGIQKPPLTRLVQGLEAELGIRLLHRTSRGVNLTEAGRALLEEASVVLAHAERTEEVVRRTARGEQDRLAIGFANSAALHPFVSTVLRHFREMLPRVSIFMEEAGRPGALVDALLHKRLDAAFVRSPVRKVLGLMVDDVLDEPIISALPMGHPLASDPEHPTIACRSGK